tara:strand:+ start:546 stop:818 length:273 start_codon:yes stop_codon:yes gene_type:complete
MCVLPIEIMNPFASNRQFVTGIVRPVIAFMYRINSSAANLSVSEPFFERRIVAAASVFRTMSTVAQFPPLIVRRRKTLTGIMTVSSAIQT